MRKKIEDMTKSERAVEHLMQRLVEDSGLRHLIDSTETETLLVEAFAEMHGVEVGTVYRKWGEAIRLLEQVRKAAR